MIHYDPLYNHYITTIILAVYAHTFSVAGTPSLHPSGTYPMRSHAEVRDARPEGMQFPAQSGSVSWRDTKKMRDPMGDVQLTLG